MRGRRVRWLVAVAVVMVLCYVVPYTLLRDHDAWYGSFLFWSVAALTVIGINAVVSSDWRD